ncbi:hypothetical protein [Kordiimonas aestuarii]|uniref:hypothetical protein n=1 Tax=Kordiimonas aestuarii TaxID=1005925 RepID=UPI0021D20E40|nr:hypothetical protein [Kordiimonas aestuarii]
MYQHQSTDRITLAIYPNGPGFGFALFRNTDAILAWGVKRAAGDKNKVCVRKFIRLLNKSHPTDIVLEDIPREQEHRRPRVADLIISLAQISMAQGCEVHFYSRAQIREAFQTRHAFTKQEIAEAVGAIIPNLTHLVPPHKKPWEVEHKAMSYFSAASLALTHFHVTQHG